MSKPNLFNGDCIATRQFVFDLFDALAASIDSCEDTQVAFRRHMGKYVMVPPAKKPLTPEQQKRRDMFICIQNSSYAAGAVAAIDGQPKVPPAHVGTYDIGLWMAGYNDNVL